MATKVAPRRALAQLLLTYLEGRNYTTRNPYTIPEVGTAFAALGIDKYAADSTGQVHTVAFGTRGNKGKKRLNGTPRTCYFVQSRGLGGKKREKCYYKGKCTRADEGEVGYDLKLRPYRLGPGPYTFVASPDDVEWK